MKKSPVKTIITIVMMLTSFQESYGQATSGNFTNSVQSPTDYLGWVIGSSGSLTASELTIKNEDPMSISFYTNAGNASLNNMRMWIYDGNGQPNDGFVGIGDFATAGATPQQLLHILDNANGVAFTQFTNSALSGHTAGNGLLVGNNGTVAEIQQQEAAALNFLTANTQRMSNS
ncbi:MAG TPA: hypothetical protein VE933_13570 [Chitinophagaceae bacterium]|nr:hypothetical protein [Chitinophagaceae bacterium]